MNMFLYSEYFSLLFKHYGYFDVDCFCFRSKSAVIFILDRTVLESGISSFVYIFVNKLLIQIRNRDQVTTTVYHWPESSVISFNKKRRHSVIFCNTVVVGSECRSNVNDTCSVFCCYKVASQYFESSFSRIHPVYELFVAHPF